MTNRLAKRGTASGFALVSCLTARWTLSSAASGQDVPGQEGDDDDRRRDSDDGNGGGGYDHTAILASLFGVETRRRAGFEMGPVRSNALTGVRGAISQQVTWRRCALHRRGIPGPVRTLGGTGGAL